jgi:hypothetical protein
MAAVKGKHGRYARTQEVLPSLKKVAPKIPSCAKVVIHLIALR